MISIVMPIYNTPSECLVPMVQSILTQTYCDFELILVDDGSASGIAELCDDMAHRDDRVRAIHQANGGVSAARNRGAAAACGDYIMYADADDILYENALEECAEAIASTHADFIFAGIKKMKDKSEMGSVPHRESLDCTLFGKEDLDDVKRSFLGQNNPLFQNVFGGGTMNRGPCARVLRADIAKEIPFDPALKIGEDVVWNMQVLSSVSEVCFVDSVWYGYITYDDSTINRYYGNRAEILGDYLSVLYANDPDFCERHRKEYLSNMVAAFHTVLSQDFMSAVCPLSPREKRAEVKNIMHQQPWCAMMDRQNFRLLSSKHKIMVCAGSTGMGLAMLKVWESIK